MLQISPSDALNVVLWAAGLHLLFDAWVVAYLIRLDRLLSRIIHLVPKRESDHIVNYQEPREK